MTENLQQLFIERENLMNQAKNFLDTHSDESGKIKKDSAKEFEKLERHIEALTFNIDRELSKPSGMKPLLNYPQNNFGGVFEFETEQTKPVKCGTVAGENYHREFFNQCRKNFRDAHNTLQTSPLTQGGYLLPEAFFDHIVSELKSENVLRQISNVIQTENDRRIVLATNSTTAQLVAEGQEIPLSSAEFAQKSLLSFKLATGVGVTNELLNDSYYDVENYLAEQFGQAIGTAEENLLLNGTGTAEPYGLANILADNAATATIQTTGANIAADDLINLVYELAAPYRKDACFLMNDSTIAAVRKIKDADQNYIWTQGLLADEPNRLLGYPVYSSRFMPSIATGNIPVIFGNFSKFVIGIRGEFSFKPLYELGATRDTTIFLGIERFDCCLTDNAAMKGLRIK